MRDGAGPRPAFSGYGTLYGVERPATGNLFEQLPDASQTEKFETLSEGAGFRVERIVSRGQASAENFWYDQPRDEWVAVLTGRARLEIEVPPSILDLVPGDWIHLPARCRHRVVATDADDATIWVAVHDRSRP